MVHREEKSDMFVQWICFHSERSMKLHHFRKMYATGDNHIWSIKAVSEKIKAVWESWFLGFM